VLVTIAFSRGIELKTRPFRKWRVVAVVGAVVFFVCGVAAVMMSTAPFGPIFKSVAGLAAAGLVVSLGALSLRILSARPAWKLIPGGFLLLVTTAAALLAAVLLFDSRLLLCYGIPRGLTVEQWTEDLHVLATAMEERHPDLFSLVGETEFSERVAEIEARIPALDSNGIKAEFAGLVALPRDAHSFPNVFTFSLDWHIFPLQLYEFDDGLYVIDAGRESRVVVGSRLVAVGGHAIDAVSRMMRRYLAAENDHGWKDRFCLVAVLAEWLHAAGIIDNAWAAEFTFETPEGQRYVETLKPVHYIPNMYWSSMRKVDDNSPPPIPNDRKTNYRFEYLEPSGTLYFQFNKMVRQPDVESIDDFIGRLGDWVDTHDFDRFVVDLRVNDGGNSAFLGDFVDFIADNDKINRDGRLFAIVSRRTFSAAVMFTAMLVNTTKVIVVGEPTGQGPFFFGGPQPVELPHSKQQYLISSHFTQSDFDCRRRGTIEPDIRVPYTHEDFLAGRDPAMEAILAYIHDRPSQPAIDPDRARTYVGRYRFDPCRALIVDRTGERLTFRITDFVDGSSLRMCSDLYPVSENRFSTDVDGVELVFDAGKNKRVRFVSVVCGRDTIRADRMPDGAKLPLELITEGNIEDGVAAILQHRDELISRFDALETMLNALGYDWLREERYAEAIEVFELNVKLFPESFNVYDSLGEGFFLNGDVDAAILNYQRSLELNPNNANATAMLKRLRG
jgi:hypothetical protein